MTPVFVLVPVLFLIAPIAATAQPNAESPIRVGNAQINPLDWSVTYEYVNGAIDVTAYEVNITRHLSDGSTIVSRQGQDWFSSSGYASVSAAADSVFCVWLPGRPDATPGQHLHPLSPRPRTTAYVMGADVTLTAVIKLDGSAIGRQRVLERLFGERRAMLTEYSYWIPRLERIKSTEDPLSAFAIAVKLLEKRRRDELSPGPREALLRATTQYQRWSEEHPDDAGKIFDAIIKVANHQIELLTDQTVRREWLPRTNDSALALDYERACR